MAVWYCINAMADLWLGDDGRLGWGAWPGHGWWAAVMSPSTAVTLLYTEYLPCCHSLIAFTLLIVPQTSLHLHLLLCYQRLLSTNNVLEVLRLFQFLWTMFSALIFWLFKLSWKCLLSAQKVNLQLVTARRLTLQKLHYRSLTWL